MTRVQILARRAAALAVVAYAAPLLALEYVVTAAKGSTGCWWLSRHLDRVDDLLSYAEAACLAAGDRRFVKWLGDLTDRLTDGLFELEIRLAKGLTR